MVCMANPKLVWHPARLVKEGGFLDLSMGTIHLRYSLVPFGSEGSALSLLFPPRSIMQGHCPSKMTKDHFLVIFHGSK